jgi:hypothetical protein
VSLKASYEVQSRRSVVERIIRKINEWRVLEDFRADQVAEFDAWLDCICALVNLRILAKANRLAEIPADEPPGAQHRIFSKQNPNPLPAIKVRRKGLPAHFERLFEDGPNFAGRKWERSFRPVPLQRGVSRVLSGYVLQINCCALDGGAFLISFHAAASVLLVNYLGGIMVDKSNFFLKHACACTAGEGGLADDSDSDEVVRRGDVEKGGCSHIAACLELLSQVQEKPADFDLIVRKHKGQRLDEHFRHTPLQFSLEQLEEARKRVYLGKTPLDDRAPIPVCICRNAESHYASGVNVVCSTCKEVFHNRCIGLSKRDARELGDDWMCGFCLEAEGQLSNSDDMGQDDGDAGDQDAVEDEQRWTLKKVARKRRGQAKNPIPQDVTYTRSWSETPAYYQQKKLRREGEARGYGTWDDLSDAIRANSEKNMALMKRLKSDALAALKHGGHHVSDTQGADGLQSVQLTPEVFDNLCDAGLLDVEAMEVDDDK